MKRIVLFFLFSLAYLCHAQDCTTCKQNEYPFIGCCDRGHSFEKCTKCSHDPLYETDFRPWKKCDLNDTLVDYNWQSCPYVTLVWTDTIHIPYDQRIVFNSGDIRNDITWALLDWIMVCVPMRTQNGDCDNCRIKIFWAREEYQMQGLPGSIAITHQPCLTPSSGTCRVECDSSYIAINALNDYMECDPDTGGYPANEKFIYTNPNMANKSTLKWYHFQSVIEHEIGHWLGLGDVGSKCSTDGAVAKNTLMWKDGEPAYEKTLSDIDKCMFKLLYCCEPQGVQDPMYEKLVNLTIAPSPSIDEVNIKYYLPDNTKITINLYNLNGELVKTIIDNEPEYQGDIITRFNTQGIPSGEYYYELKFNNIRLTKKSIIIH